MKICRQSARSGSHAASRAANLGFFRQVADAVKAGKGEAQDCRPGNHRDNMRIARPERTSARQRTSAFTFKYAINNHGPDNITLRISTTCNTTITVLKFATDFRLRRLKAVIKATHAQHPRWNGRHTVQNTFFASRMLIIGANR